MRVMLSAMSGTTWTFNASNEGSWCCSTRFRFIPACAKLSSSCSSVFDMGSPFSMFAVCTRRRCSFKFSCREKPLPAFRLQLTCGQLSCFRGPPLHCRVSDSIMDTETASYCRLWTSRWWRKSPPEYVKPGIFSHPSIIHLYGRSCLSICLFHSHFRLKVLTISLQACWLFRQYIVTLTLTSQPTHVHTNRPSASFKTSLVGFCIDVDAGEAGLSSKSSFCSCCGCCGNSCICNCSAELIS